MCVCVFWRKECHSYLTLYFIQTFRTHIHYLKHRIEEKFARSLVAYCVPTLQLNILQWQLIPCVIFSFSHVCLQITLCVGIFPLNESLYYVYFVTYFFGLSFCCITFNFVVNGTNSEVCVWNKTYSYFHYILYINPCATKD